MIKELILQEDIVLSIYAPNKGASKCMRQKPMELKGEISKSTIIGGDATTHLSVIDR